MTMPAMAPPESLLDDPDPDSGTDPLQAASGPPQREFPEKAESGKPENLDGISPVNWLLDTLKRAMFVLVRSGIEPVNALFSRYNVAKRVKLLIEVGMVPEKLLLAKLTLTRFGSVENESGMGPEKRLFWR